MRTAVLLSAAAYLAADLHLLHGPLWKLFFGPAAPATTETPQPPLPVYEISTEDTPQK